MIFGIFKKSAAIAALALSVAGVGSTAQAALTVTVGGGPLTTSDISYQNFDATMPPYTFAPTNGNASGGNITVSFTAGLAGGQPAQFSSSGNYAAPWVETGSGAKFGNTDNAVDTTQYLTTGTGTVTLDFAKNQNYVGLLWGSIDDYNTLKLYNGSTLVDTVTSTLYTQIAPDGGDQGSSGSRYVNIVSTQAFNKVVFLSTQKAFEFDNVAYRAVPEPASLAMTGTALLAVAGVVLRRRKAQMAA
jgi:hypothetical protein